MIKMTVKFLFNETEAEKKIRHDFLKKKKVQLTSTKERKTLRECQTEENKKRMMMDSC